MKLVFCLGLAFSVVTPALAQTPTHPPPHQERHDDRGNHPAERREDHREAREFRKEEHLPPRVAPAWRGHPPGTHPASPGYHPSFHPHAVRVLRPRAMRYGEHPWRHWVHLDFVRPLYYWEWPLVRSVTCVAEDSYGDQYPVTESTFAGFGLVNMTAVEDDALDRCYEESGGDPNCFLATCSHY